MNERAAFGDEQYEHLRTERHDAVAVISLDRTRAKNALNEEMRREIRRACTAAAGDDGIRAVLFTGEGDSFCAGADIAELKERTMLRATWSPDRIDTVVEDLGKPVIGALHGHVLGGGLELALAFTMRIAADNFRGALPEIKLGVFPGLGGTQRLPRMVGEGRALDLILTGRTFDAAEALALGLVSAVVPLAELRQRALDLARKLASGPPIATRVVIETVRRASDLGRSEGLDYERRLLGVVCGTQDKDEGVAAWLEKRRPEFKGR
jgi:enoyl-CoA hydratase/carnithine racemase